MSTVHTIDAPKALDRVIDVFPADQQAQITTQLANTLQAVVSQRLLPRADKTGRVLATEVMRVNHGIRSIIVERRFQQLIGLIQVGGKDGMHTFDDSLRHLLLNGHITLEEALANCREPKAMQESFNDALAARARAR
jgi:twitching motility protein PilT